VEGREVFQGKVDVLVTDGFTGNVFLKTCEGASSFFLDYLQPVQESCQVLRRSSNDSMSDLIILSIQAPF